MLLAIGSKLMACCAAAARCKLLVKALGAHVAEAASSAAEAASSAANSCSWCTPQSHLVAHGLVGHVAHDIRSGPLVSGCVAQQRGLGHRDEGLQHLQTTAGENTCTHALCTEDMQRCSLATLGQTGFIKPGRLSCLSVQDSLSGKPQALPAW